MKKLFYSLPFILGVFCFIISAFTPKTITPEGFLIEPFFFLIPIGYLLILIGIISLLIKGIFILFKKKKS